MSPPLSPESNHAEELRALGITVAPASDSFLKWLQQRQPDWLFMNAFVLAIPIEWGIVKKDGFELCQLASEQEIIEMSNNSPDCGLLPIGSLMDGSILVLDMLDNETMQVGMITSDHVMSTSGPQIIRQEYQALPFSYGSWLAHIRQNPLDVRYR